MIHPENYTDYDQTLEQIVESIVDSDAEEWFLGDPREVVNFFVVTYHTGVDTCSTTAYRFTPPELDLNICPFSVLRNSDNWYPGGGDAEDVSDRAAQVLVVDLLEKHEELYGDDEE